MRIAFFTEAFDPFTNGVVVLVKAYRQAMEAAGHEVVVFTPEHDDQPDCEFGVVRLPSFTFHRDFYPILRPFASINRRFQKGEFDVIHSHHPFSCGLLAERLSKKHGVPLVYTFHTLLTNQAAHIPGPAKLAEMGMMQVIKRHCEHAHCVTASTEVMKRWLEEKGIDSPVKIVRPTAPTMIPSPGSRERLRAQWNVSASTVLGFCATRLSPEKDVDLLLQAVALVPKTLDFRLVIAGSGPDMDELIALSKGLDVEDRVKFIGEVPHEEIADYYAAADVFTFPSRNDTLGMVVLEAMASGLPVICSDVNGPAEVVRHGVDGYHTSEDARVLAHAIMRVVVDPDLRQRLAAGAREGCLAFCTPDTATGLMEAYETAKLTRLDRPDPSPRARRANRNPRMWI